MARIGAEFAEKFRHLQITKVLTIESSGIAPALMTSFDLKVPLVFARKQKSRILNNEVFSTTVYSYTKQSENQISISKKIISASDRILIIDDFLANGQAVQGLLDIIEQAQAQAVGVGIVIEKAFQKGHQLILSKHIPLFSLASIDHLVDGKVIFSKKQEQADVKQR